MPDSRSVISLPERSRREAKGKKTEKQNYKKTSLNIL